MKFLNKSAIFLLIIAHILFILFVRNAVYPLHYVQKSFFFSFEFLVLLDLGNLVLLWLIGRKIFNKFYFIPSLVYTFIPWSCYLVVAESFYIYLLFLLLFTLYFFIFLKSKKILILVMIIPIFLGIRNILEGEVKIFSDPGLMNTINSYQGAAREEGFGYLARISENKYIFKTEYIFLKYLKQFLPITYFTSQERLLGFSFSPPIYLGFLLPFLYGLHRILKEYKLRRYFLLSTVLVIPSVLSKQMVDLNRLILFSPVVIFIISLGFIKLVEQRKKAATLVILLSLGLVLFQFIITLSDINLREKERQIKYFGQSIEIGKQ